MNCEKMSTIFKHDHVRDKKTFTVLVNVLFMLEALISLRNLNEDLWTQMSVQNTHVINLNTQVKILISDTVGNVI